MPPITDAYILQPNTSMISFTLKILLLLIITKRSTAIVREIWGFNAFPDSLPGITELSFDDTVRIFVKNVSQVHELYLSRYPNCDVISATFTNLIRLPEQRSILAEIANKTVPITTDRWPYPYAVCSHMNSKLSTNALVNLKSSDGSALAILIVLYLFFVILSIVFTGLHLAMMSVKKEILELVRDFDEDDKQRVYATDILSIRRNENFVLCTLLCCNTVANSTSTVLLSAIYYELGIPDETLYQTPQMFIILVFGEVMPQVICSTKYGLSVASRLQYFTGLCMALTAVLTYPLGLLLDFLIRNRDNSADVAVPVEPMDKLRNDIQLYHAMNTLKLKTRLVKDILQPIEKVLLVSDKKMIDRQLRDNFQKENRTRIPVYAGDDKDMIIGILNFKDVLVLKDDFPVNVGTFLQLWHRSSLFHFVNARTPIVSTFIEMKKGVSVAIAFEFNKEQNKNVVLGMFTLEDIIEEVTGELYDEFDKRRAQSNPNSVKKREKTSKEADTKPTTTQRDKKEKSMAPKKMEEKKIKRTEPVKRHDSATKQN